MRCERARRGLSAAADGAATPAEREHVAAHVGGCVACAAYERRLSALRRAVRFEVVGEDVPDVAPAVLARVEARHARRRAAWTSVAAAFVAGVVAGATLVGSFGGEAPRVATAAGIPERVAGAQAAVSSLTARLELVERGWHPDVPERRYDGTLAYRAPESLALSLTDRTTYPDDRWPANDVDLVVDGSRAWSRGPASCPTEAQPGCSPPEPVVRAVSGREPFRDAAPAPLDLVVPVASFKGAAEPQRLGTRSVGGREAVGVATTAAQVAPLLAALTHAGNLREVHPADPVELWLDVDAFVPLALVVRAGDGPERGRWAARHGYQDAAGTALLDLELTDVAVNGTVPADVFAPPPPGATVRDGGFRDVDDVDVPQPSWLPDGMRAHRAGVLTGGSGDVSVSSWSDGRAWVKIRATRAWEGGRLFGLLGQTVRRVELGSGVAYVGEGGSAVALHGAAADVVVTGSLDEDGLRKIADGLGVRGRAVPGDWAEAGTLDAAEISEQLPGALAPPRLDGFAPAAASARDGVVTIVVTGAGARAFTLTQSAGDRLTPPLEPDVQGVEVRGTAGRWTPRSGELEWVEDGQVVTLGSATLSLEELAAVAERLEPAP